MTWFGSSCKKFSYLLNQMEDRDLKPAEERFFDGHLSNCQNCVVLLEGTEGLNLLRSMGQEPVEISHGFTDRVLRRAHLDSKRSSVAYWSPAIVGGVIACIAVFTALQMIARPSQMPVFSTPSVETRLNVAEPLIPAIDFDSRRSPMP